MAGRQAGSSSSSSSRSTTGKVIVIKQVISNPLLRTGKTLRKTRIEKKKEKVCSRIIVKKETK